MRPVQPQKDGPLSNEDIASPEVQLIDAEGVNQGAVKTRDALAQAQELGLDLVIIAGNDEGAVEQVADLARKAGFSVENAGKLDAARLIEPVGMLNIRFAYGLGRGPAIAPAWVKGAA